MKNQGTQAVLTSYCCVKEESEGYCRDAVLEAVCRAARLLAFLYHEVNL